jgi:invasion protein IalB
MAQPDPLAHGPTRTKRAIWRTVLITGAGLALTAATAFYVVLGAPSVPEILARLRGEPAIARGFIGMANFGHWRLICIPGPAPLNGLTPPTAASGPGGGINAAPGNNACRVNQEMPAPQDKGESSSEPAKVLIAANFSLVGVRRMPAAMLRLPPTAQPGDTIALRFDDGSTIKTMVRDCAAAECLATGALSEADWDRLASAKSLQVTFPVAGRQWVLLDLPVEGLATAMAALARAENPPRG